MQEALRIAVAEPDETTAIRRILDSDLGVLAKLQRDIEQGPLQGAKASAAQLNTLDLLGCYGPATEMTSCSAAAVDCP